MRLRMLHDRRMAEFGHVVLVRPHNSDESRPYFDIDPRRLLAYRLGRLEASDVRFEEGEVERFTDRVEILWKVFRNQLGQE